MKSKLILTTLIILVSCNTFVADKDKLIKNVTEIVEEAYFEGQKDALNNDIRIRLNPVDSTYYWIKSPHNDGTKPIFNPTYLNTKQ